MKPHDIHEIPHPATTGQTHETHEISNRKNNRYTKKTIKTTSHILTKNAREALCPHSRPKKKCRILQSGAFSAISFHAFSRRTPSTTNGFTDSLLYLGLRGYSTPCITPPAFLIIKGAGIGLDSIRATASSKCL